MNAGRLFLLFLVICLALNILPEPLPAWAQTPAPQYQEVCDHYLNRFYGEPDWRARLMDPVYSTPEQVLERYNLYLPVYDCLSTGDVPVTGEQAEARELVGYFLTLAGGALHTSTTGPGQGGAIRFSDLQDPAVVALREEAGLPEPEGYIYVWLYPSLEAMPEELRPFFRNDNVRGMTLLTRYIVILDHLAQLSEDQQGTGLEDYQRDQRARVYSHEYVHAYVKSVLGPDRAFTTPEWFDEGLAIYFSGSGEPSSQVYLDDQGSQVFITTPPEEYARYRDTFKYLEREHGREKLLALIRTAVLDADPGRLYRDLGITDDQELLRIAEESREELGLERLGLLVLFLAGMAVLIVVVSRLLRRGRGLPSVPSGSPLDAYYMRSRGDLHGLERMLLRQNDSLDVGAVQSRMEAAIGLHDLNDPTSVLLLAQALQQDRSSSVRAAAARSLGQMADLHRRAAPLDPASRVRALEVLFPALRQDPAEEVRMMATEAIFRSGGTAALRPLKAVLREEMMKKRVSTAFQLWLVSWTIRNGLEKLMIELYPWFGEEAQQFAINQLRWQLSPGTLEQLGQAAMSADPALRALADAVLHGRPEEGSEPDSLKSG